MSGGSGGVVAAVAVGAGGDEALDDAFEAGRALGERLDVLAPVLVAGVDLGAPGAAFGLDFGTQGAIVGSEFRSQVLDPRVDVRPMAFDFSTDLGAEGAVVGLEGLVVGAGVAPEHEEQADQDQAQREDGNEFGVHGAAPRVQGEGLQGHGPPETEASTGGGSAFPSCLGALLDFAPDPAGRSGPWNTFQ